MVADPMAYAKRCQVRQIHVNFIHHAPEPFHPMVASCPFAQWDMDIVGPIDPPSIAELILILIAIDYFSKWAEDVPLKQVPMNIVAHFVRHHIIYKFDVPDWITFDIGP
ncbi:uncharacterized protein LOC105421733 [Amborella trichopoda]|uniref:uncharacterized protein LOC105421733 n=1 Tax=Amborella trichopoda TaxID=13333 RepID=UPI0005D36BAE|nr:uncharacterized protein LOC105421733 [Amborella trichopoda]|eukprot:XP_011628544.1 uncharacterized protein LOC105421733 [Amborella trichopoda]